MIELKDNYQDDVLDSEKNQLRKYNMIHNDDGTVSFVDATVYSQNGDNFGAKDVNDIVARIGEISKAENIDYDNTKSVKGAIDECVRTLGYIASNNLLPNTASTTTKNNLKFTVNVDKSVTVVGTPTADTYLTIGSTTLEKDDYILSGCPSGGSASGYRLYCHNFLTGITIQTDLGESETFTLDDVLKVSVSILVKSGTVMNHTFYPMISKTVCEYEPCKQNLYNRLEHNDYLNIIDKLTINETNCNIHTAIVKNGNVHIGGYALKQTLSQSYELFTINDKNYIPFFTVLATIGSFHINGDAQKINNISLSPNAKASLWNVSAMSDRVFFYFVYPLI